MARHSASEAGIAAELALGWVGAGREAGSPGWFFAVLGWTAESAERSGEGFDFMVVELVAAVAESFPAHAENANTLRIARRAQMRFMARR